MAIVQKVGLCILCDPIRTDNHDIKIKELPLIVYIHTFLIIFKMYTCMRSLYTFQTEI